ncbi:TPA: RIP metalloprotease [Candidatus Saccharibacteria bacterium]|nr:RIP metalloprotease [Candidatus Saccharibacteria bacterium]HIO87224.1 RIP metalloprotease [Candidatus Saccharibacteria bacterium]
MMIFLGLILFVLIIVVHEYGHFLAAKRNGVEAEEFGIGFPPKIAGKTMGKGIFRGYYTLNWLPFGGFVKLKGENSEDKRKGSFGAASFWVKTKIILAGVFMNVVFAVMAFSIVAAIEIPRFLPNQFTVKSEETVIEQHVDIVRVEEGSPADQAGLIAGQSIESIAGEDVNTLDDLNRLVEKYAGQTVGIGIVPTEAYQTGEFSDGVVQAELRADPEDGESYLGVGLNSIDTYRVSPWAAPIAGAGLTVQIAGETLHFLGDLVTSPFRGDFQEQSQGIAGPVGLVFGIFPAVDSLLNLLFLGGVISVSLAIMNALPIPALDGGRLAVTGLFLLLKKPLTAEVENRIHGSGMVFFLFLAVLITYSDILKL